jgi:hypothetical protein
MGSNMVTSIVRTACDRDEARFKLVAPTDRCFVAALERIRIREAEHNFFSLLVQVIKFFDGGDGNPCKISDKNHATIIFSDGEFGGLHDYVSLRNNSKSEVLDEHSLW